MEEYRVLLLPAFDKYLSERPEEICKEILNKYKELQEERRKDSQPIYKLIDMDDSIEAQKLLDEYIKKWGENDVTSIKLQTFIDLI